MRLRLKRPALYWAIFAEMICPQWWGMPAYPTQVAGLIDTRRVTNWKGTDDELATALLEDPLSVPLDSWEQIVGGNGYGWLDR